MRGFLNDAGDEAGGGAESGEAIVEIGAERAGEEDEWLAAQGGERKLAAGGQRVGCRQDRHKRFFENHLGFKRSGGAGLAEESEVDLVSAQSILDGAGGHFAKGKLDRGIADAVFADGRGKARQEDGGRRGDAEMAGLAAGRAPRKFDGAVNLRKDAAGFVEQGDARFRQAGFAAALKELAAEAGFEFLDLLGERRLGDADALGGASEVELFGYGEEVAELAKVGRVHMKIISTVSILNIGHISGRERILRG